MRKHHMSPFKVRGKAGHRIAHRGKGSTEQRLDDGDRNNMFDSDGAGRSQNQYGKDPNTPSPSQPQLSQTPSDPDHDGDNDMMAAGDTDHDWQ